MFDSDQSQVLLAVYPVNYSHGAGCGMGSKASQESDMCRERKRPAGQEPQLLWRLRHEDSHVQGQMDNLVRMCFKK